MIIALLLQKEEDESLSETVKKTTPLPVTPFPPPKPSPPHFC